MMFRPSRSPLRVGALVSVCLHLVLFAVVMLFVHGTPVHPLPKKRVILTLNLAAPAPPPPLTPPKVPPPTTPPPPTLAPLPKPLPRPVTSRATAKAIPAVPPLPSRPEPKPKALAQPAPLPVPATPQPGVVGHHVSTDYKGLLEGKIRANLHYPRMARRQGREGTAIVRVRMKRDGSIESVELVKSSGTRALDHEAQAVFDRIGQLPPLPQDFLPRASEFEFEVPITFKLVNGFGP